MITWAVLPFSSKEVTLVIHRPSGWSPPLIGAVVRWCSSDVHYTSSCLRRMPPPEGGRSVTVQVLYSLTHSQPVALSLLCSGGPLHLLYPRQPRPSYL